jgi:outer membrane receptor for ferrienterochelin and colicins
MRFGALIVVAAVRLWLPAATAAQGTVTGTVVDAVTGTPLGGETVQLRGTLDTAARSAITSPRGTFRFTGLAPDRYRLTAAVLGYAPGASEADVGGSALEPLRVTLQRIYVLEERVVTPDRAAGSSLGAPTALNVVGRQQLERRIAVGGPVEQLAGVTGVDVAQRGIAQRTFSARGPGGINSGALLVLSDFRPVSLPSLRFNIPYLIAPGDEELERIEVVRGPGSALYGPDADRGVVHLVTSSPLARPGTAIAISGGGRALIDGSVRQASRLGSRVGFRVSASYLGADDWTFVDPAERGGRDRRLERAAGDARVDWQAGAATTVSFSGGAAEAIRMVDQSELGALQLRNWRSAYVQGRVDDGRFFANAYVNFNDAGRSFQLRTLAPQVDDSRMLGLQLQHASSVGGPISLRYGVDLQHVVSRTGGTLHGANEDDDGITQVGGYLSALARVGPRVDLVGALRGDHHNRLDDFVVSPRVGLVFRPGGAHAVRLTFNRASSTPVAADLFLDLDVQPLREGYPIRVRAAGALRPFTFARGCGGVGDLCMHSPFAAGPLPADATLLWPAVQQIAGGALDDVPAPSSAQVATRLGVYDLASGALRPVLPGDVTDIPAARRSMSSSFEVGYRGQLVPWLSAAVDVAHTRITNIGNSLTVQTPAAFLDSLGLAAYLEAAGAPADAAAAIAARVSSLPLGVVSPEQARDPTAVLLVPRQGGTARYWNVDVELDASVTPWLNLRGSWSWVSEDLFRRAVGLGDMALNAPRSKASLGALVTELRSGTTLDLRARWVGAFPVRAGVYTGTVQRYAVADLDLGLPVPGRREVTLSLAVTNLFGNRHRELVGAPLLGRLLVGRVRVAF